MCPDGKERSFYLYSQQNEEEFGKVLGYVVIQERSLGHPYIRVPGHVTRTDLKTFHPYESRAYLFKEIKERRQILNETGFDTWVAYRGDLELKQSLKREKLGPPDDKPLISVDEAYSQFVEQNKDNRPSQSVSKDTD